MSGVDMLSILMSTTLILMMYTILYRESPAFRLGEHIMVGSTVGHAVVLAVFNVRDLALLKFQDGLGTGNLSEVAYIIPIILGILIYFQFSKTYRRISRVSIATMLGVGLALSIRGLLYNNVIGQIMGAIKPLTNIENIIFMVGVVCVLLYFVYERRASTIAGPLPKVGRYLLMLTMGSYFANSIMGRLSIVIGTLNELLVAPAWYLIPVALLIVAADAITRSKKT